jgi:hypothetical protein
MRYQAALRSPASKYDFDDKLASSFWSISALGIVDIAYFPGPSYNPGQDPIPITTEV